jgi:hypothetical protein
MGPAIPALGPWGGSSAVNPIPWNKNCSGNPARPQFDLPIGSRLGLRPCNIPAEKNWCGLDRGRSGSRRLFDLVPRRDLQGIVESELGRAIFFRDSFEGKIVTRHLLHLPG